MNDSPRFPVRRLGGYVIEDVDAFFDGIERRTADEALDVWVEKLRRA